MNRSSFLLFLLTVSSLTITEVWTQSTDCLPEDNSTIPPVCADYLPDTKYVPHPSNCSLFWECGPDGEHCLNECPKAGEDTILYFNPVLNVCDWPENVNCSMIVSSTILKEKRQQTELGKSVDDGCLPDDEAVPPNCDDFVHVTYIPHPFNCSRYWECQPQSGHCLYECPLLTTGTNLYFNPDLQVCDWPDNVDCKMGECNCADWQTCVSGICTPDCKDDSHCSSGQYCDGGECKDGCRTDSDCQGTMICVDHACQAECSSDSDCAAGEVCTNGSCESSGCSSDSDCSPDEYCSGSGNCLSGCSTDSSCPGCEKCVNHECLRPECCTNSDCADPSKPICSEANVCMEGCLRNKHCPGWNATCDLTNSNCNYCDQMTHTCQPGCHTAANCDGYHCTAQHTCTIGLKDITLNTFTCVGCQGSQGIKDEDGPFVILVGTNGVSCNTRQLDHPDLIDFDNGKISTFSTESILQSCYKIDLGAGVIDGSIHWTSLDGVWAPKNKMIEINFSGSEENSECCCLSKSSLSVSSAVGSLVDCHACKDHPGCN